MTDSINEDFVVFAKLSELKPEALLSRILFNQIQNQEKNMGLIDDVKNMLGDLSNQFEQIHGKNQAAAKALSDENISLNRRNAILEETIRSNETDMKTASDLIRKVSTDLKADDSAPTDQVMETYSLTETTTVEQPADQGAPTDNTENPAPAEDTNTTTNPVPQPEQPTTENPVPQPEQPTTENPVPQPTEVVTPPTDAAEAPANPVVTPIPDPAPDLTDAAPAPAPEVPADVVNSTPAPAENTTPVYTSDADKVNEAPAVNSPAVQYNPPLDATTAPAVDTNVVNTGTPSVQNLENAPTPSVDVPNVPNV